MPSPFKINRSNEFSEAEHEAIEKALRRRLGPNFVSERPAAGGQRVVYLEVSLSNRDRKMKHTCHHKP